MPNKRADIETAIQKLQEAVDALSLLERSDSASSPVIQLLRIAKVELQARLIGGENEC